MASTTQTLALEHWLQTNGGSFHPHVRILHSPEAGVHMRAIQDIAPGTTVATAPHSLTLSYLNAVVDPLFPVFANQRHRFKVEAIGFFYLMAQWLDKESSFWKPYLDTLPTPESELSQPLFFEDPEDIAWLAETDVWHTVTARRVVYEKYYTDGIEVLREAGIDVQGYTWHLFKWAISTYTSRSFSSRSLRPVTGNVWTAYRSSMSAGNVGEREGVLLDMSKASTEDLHFPVLFPGLDAANHNPDAKVDWTFSTNSFTVALAQADETRGVEGGEEVFNNYGPKSNGELLIGYGFCIPNNPNDTVAMTLKPPPPPLETDLRTIHPTYFTADGSWDPTKTTTHLHHPTIPTQTSSGLAYRPQIFHHLPSPLLELLVHILRHERHLPFFPLPDSPLAYLTDPNKNDGVGRRYLPHIARMIVQSLAPKLAKLSSSAPAHEPRNQKQTHAAVYRRGQISIISALMAALKAYTRALIYRPGNLRVSDGRDMPIGPTLISLEAFMALLDAEGVLEEAFLRGVEASAGTGEVEVLRAAGWEEDVWVLLICYLLLEGPSEESASRRWSLRGSLGECVRLPRAAGEEGRGIKQPTQQELAAGEDTMGLVRAAAAACPGSKWERDEWTAAYIAAVGGKVVEFESFLVMVPVSTDRVGDAEQKEEARLFVYFDFR